MLTIAKEAVVFSNFGEKCKVQFACYCIGVGCQFCAWRWNFFGWWCSMIIYVRVEFFSMVFIVYMCEGILCGLCYFLHRIIVWVFFPLHGCMFCWMCKLYLKMNWHLLWLFLLQVGVVCRFVKVWKWSWDIVTHVMLLLSWLCLFC